MLGETIAHYKITAKLGEGGMGAVYRATDSKLNREVAIKVLPDTFAADPDRLARFTREAQVLASLNHPNIATIFGVEDKALVMELVEGNDLTGPLPLTEALQIARQIAEGLEAAHDKGIIHRDLKPANIKVTPEGIVKLLDFGLAKATDSAATTTSTDSPTMTLRATQAGIIMGTAGYMSPEQAAGKTVDKRADIWAFGVVLHELLTGKRLFHGETVSHTLASVLKDPIDFTIPQAPQPIQQLLARCLDRNLKHRLKDIGEARIAIEDFLANPKPKAQAKPAKRPTLWIASSAALLLALVALILWRQPAPPVGHVSHFSIPAPAGSSVQVSPDGNWLLMHVDGGYKVRRLDSANWLKLTGTEAAVENTSFWSADSSAIGFVSSNRLRTHSLDGAPPRDLMAVEDFRGASWRGGRTDGAILLATHGKLKSFDLRSGSTTDLPLEFKAGLAPSRPKFLPEGDGFVFVYEGGENGRLFRSSLKSAAMDPLLQTMYSVDFARHPATGKWHIFYLAGEPELQSSRSLQTAQIDPKSGLLLSAPLKLIQGVSTTRGALRTARFSVGGGGPLSWTYNSGSLPIWQLNWVDLDGKLLARLTETRNYDSIALSPDETSIAVQGSDPDPHIWILDSKTGLGRRMANTPEKESCPYWSRDSKSIFYVSASGNQRQIKQHFLDGSTAPQVLWQSGPETSSFAHSTILVGVSPEGRYLLVHTQSGSLSRLDLQAPLPGKLEAFARGSSYASLSLDGRSIAWESNNNVGLAIQEYAEAAQPLKRFFRGDESFRRLFFSADGRTLFGQANRNLVAIPLNIGTTIGEPKVLRPWITSLSTGAIRGAASRDGKRLLLLETDQEEILTPQLLTDWTTLLPKQP
jgi:serine/threonine protein kinase